ncbi:hypothetical protein [Leptospira perolatii]|uniref:hypothetical protein n=1 Tax=Leptospira perolatii TaxID=2023191 RepID=UPI001FAFDE1B|nr:hypothetical protein [Leptospira perolatii]
MFVFSEAMVEIDEIADHEDFSGKVLASKLPLIINSADLLLESIRIDIKIS